MNDISEKEVTDRWNDCMKRATALAKEMVHFSQLGNQKRSMWNVVSHTLDEMRRKGNIMAQGKSLSRQQLDQHLDSWQLKVSRKTAAKAAKEKSQNRIILDA